ncbi:MAG: PorT family protein [Bacteroidales bacterium]|nr:PorT family protein [Bacteroidales bacterium]MCF8456640.1 PorT family protein [Bacteroidales bacterium]
MNIRKICFALVLVFSLIAHVFAIGKLGSFPEKAHETNLLLTRPVKTNFSIGQWQGATYSTTLFEGSFYVGNSSIVKSQFRFGQTLGFSGNYQKSNNWSFQAELLWEQKGMYFEDLKKQVYYVPIWPTPKLLTTDIKAELIMNYWSLPIVARRHFGRVVKWYMEAGPCISHLKRASIEGDMKYDYYNPYTEKIIHSTIPIGKVATGDYGLDLSMIGGLGLIIPIQKGLRGPIISLVLNGRYQHGLINVYKGEAPEELNPLLIIDPNIIVEDPVHPNDGQTIKTSVISFRLGVVVAI